MATWSLCTKFGIEEQKVFINLDNVITVEGLNDRTSIVFVNGGMEILETAPDDGIRLLAGTRHLYDKQKPRPHMPEGRGFLG